MAGQKYVSRGGEKLEGALGNLSGSLSGDGKGLTVTRENPRGTTKSVYTKS